MKISKMKIKNFRAYRDETTIDLNDLTVFVGKNDVGKSTILEALDMFFNEGKGSIKIENSDINKQCQDNNDTDVIISVTFEDLPRKIRIDHTNETTLEDEYLLDSDGKLEIVKTYPNAGKEKVAIKANHPSNPDCADMLLKKQSELRKIIESRAISCTDKNKNAVMRKAIWEHHRNELDLQEVKIDATKEDARNIWEQLKNDMPLYSLFQSDRKNSDGDSEIQDPMKLAVQEILRNEELKSTLDGVAQQIKDKLEKVADNTLEKLNEMNPEIANSLKPVIPSTESLKWAEVFRNVTISDDEDIPINKRGSGTKRLVLLNFFRAEAERRTAEKGVPGIIYAIEEPETSQHPDHQEKLIKAFIELSKSNNTQIILTTHSPAIVKLLEFEHLKSVVKTENNDQQIQIITAKENCLPRPSLNEINFLAFEQGDEDYHNELGSSPNVVGKYQATPFG